MKLLIRIGLYIAKLGGLQEQKGVSVFIDKSTKVKDELRNRIRRLYLEYSFIPNSQDRILFVDEIISKEFDYPKSDLIEIYNQVIEENTNYARATIRTS